MLWSRWVEDRIYSIFRRYDIKGKTEQQKNLKSICMNELNSHQDIKDAIKTESQLEFFIIQMALENIKQQIK